MQPPTRYATTRATGLDDFGGAHGDCLTRLPASHDNGHFNFDSPPPPLALSRRPRWHVGTTYLAIPWPQAESRLRIASSSLRRSPCCIRQSSLHRAGALAGRSQPPCLEGASSVGQIWTRTPLDFYPSPQGPGASLRVTPELQRNRDRGYRLAKISAQAYCLSRLPSPVGQFVPVQSHLSPCC